MVFPAILAIDGRWVDGRVILMVVGSYSIKHFRGQIVGHKYILACMHFVQAIVNVEC